MHSSSCAVDVNEKILCCCCCCCVWKKKDESLESKKKKKKEGKSTPRDIIIVATIILRAHTHHYCGEQHNKYIRHIEGERFICYLLVLVSF